MSITPSFASGTCSGHPTYVDADVFLSGWEFDLVRSPGNQTVVKKFKLAAANSSWHYSTQTLDWDFVTEADNSTSYIDNYTVTVNFQIVGVMNEKSYIHRFNQTCSDSNPDCSSQVVRTGILQSGSFNYVGHSFKGVSVTASTGLPITDLEFDAKSWSQSGTDLTTDIRCLLSSNSVSSTSTSCSIDLVGLEGRTDELAEYHQDKSVPASQLAPYGTTFSHLPNPTAQWYLCGLSHMHAFFPSGASRPIWSLRAGTSPSDCGATSGYYTGNWFGFLGDTYGGSNSSVYHQVDLRLVGTKLF